MQSIPTAARLSRVQSILSLDDAFADIVKSDPPYTVRKQRTGEEITVSAIAAKTAILAARDGKDACMISKKEILAYAEKAKLLPSDVDACANDVSVTTNSTCEIAVGDATGAPANVVQRSERKFQAGIYALLVCIQKLEQTETDPDHQRRQSIIDELTTDYFPTTRN